MSHYQSKDGLPQHVRQMVGQFIHPECIGDGRSNREIVCAWKDGEDVVEICRVDAGYGREVASSLRGLGLRAGFVGWSAAEGLVKVIENGNSHLINAQAFNPYVAGYDFSADETIPANEDGD